MNEETRKKISNAIRKRWKEREKHGLHGHPISNEQRVKLSKSIKRKWDNKEYDCLSERKISDEQKQRISLAVQEKWTDKIYANKNKESLSKYWNNNQNEKQRYAHLAQERWKDESYREITLAGIRRITSDPLYKEVMRQHGIRRAAEISYLNYCGKIRYL